MDRGIMPNRHLYLSPPSPRLLYILVLALGLNAILSFLLIFHPSLSHTNTSLQTTHHLHLHSSFAQNRYDDKVTVASGGKIPRVQVRKSRRMSKTRVFYIMDNSYNKLRETNNNITNFEPLQDHYSNAFHNDADDTANQAHSTNSNCTPMAAWQTTSYPTCNSIHELNIFSSGQDSLGYFQPDIIRENEERRLPFHIYQQQKVEPDSYIRKLSRILEHSPKKGVEIQIPDSYSAKILGNGWFRHAWEVTDNILGTMVAIKTLRLERDFIPEYYGKYLFCCDL